MCMHECHVAQVEDHIEGSIMMSDLLTLTARVASGNCVGDGGEGQWCE